jgi:hypothetical protein
MEDVLSRSVTVAVPSVSGIVRIVLALVVAVVLLAVGVRIGLALLSPGTAAEFADDGRLQQVVTVTDTFVGRVVSDDGTYLRLRGPAVVRDASSSSQGQLIVQLLVADPFDLDGEILVARSEVILVGNVLVGSGLETAYRQATGELPAPTPVPTAAPTSQ